YNRRSITGRLRSRVFAMLFANRSARLKNLQNSFPAAMDRRGAETPTFSHRALWQFPPWLVPGIRPPMGQGTARLAPYQSRRLRTEVQGVSQAVPRLPRRSNGDNKRLPKLCECL